MLPQIEISDPLEYTSVAMKLASEQLKLENTALNGLDRQNCSLPRSLLIAVNFPVAIQLISVTATILYEMEVPRIQGDQYQENVTMTEDTYTLPNM